MDNQFPPDSRVSPARESGTGFPDAVAAPRRGPIAQLARTDMPHWVKWQLVLPLAAFVLANFVLLQLGGDRWIAGHLYLLEGGHWALKDNLVTSTLVHETGKRLSALAWLGVLTCTVVVWRRPAWHAWRKPLLYLVLAVLLSTSVVAWMK
ncbi:MAG: hypothetical protein L0H23_07295, partial [Luteimonas sp.]|nr:hypothetical protein [Luteimonas sp.]